VDTASAQCISATARTSSENRFASPLAKRASATVRPLDFHAYPRSSALSAARSMRFAAGLRKRRLRRSARRGRRTSVLTRRIWGDGNRLCQYLRACVRDSHEAGYRPCLKIVPPVLRVLCRDGNRPCAPMSLLNAHHREHRPRQTIG
jgi:hypothetical protein